MVLIPALVVLKSELGFLIPISLLVIFIIYFYFSSFLNLYIYDRIFHGLEMFLFLTHHSCFVFMFVCQNISYLNNYLINILKYTGFVVIFTVICGGILELIDFVVEVILMILFAIYKCLKICCGVDIKRRKKQN